MAATKTSARLETPAPATPTSSEPSSFWHEVYTHPGDDALAVAGVAAATVAAAGLFAYSRGAFGLGRTGTLLIEDTPYMGKAMKQVLEDQGHTVSWLTGVKSVGPRTISGTTVDGGNLTLNLGKFRTAFVDGVLDGSPLQGADIVGPLRKGKVFSIGTSTIPEFNDVMLKNGADAVSNKGVLFTSMVNNQVEFSGRLRALALQKRLDELDTVIASTEGKPMRKAANAVVQKYMDLDSID
jgi:hypothetical protein